MKEMKNGNAIHSLHLEAMKMAQRAIVAEVQGNKEEAISLNEKAFLLEKQVALSFIDSEDELSRAVYFRSAAALALHAGKFEQSEKMIRHGLLGNPPDEIADELLDLKTDLAKKQVEHFIDSQKEKYRKKTNLKDKIAVLDQMEELVKKLAAA